jgi:hypothetical protein
MRSYEAARSLFSFLAFVAWMVIIAGVLIALIGAKGASIYGGAGAGLLAAMPGIGIAMMGFLQLAFVQIGRAGVDTAEYTQQMLKISRDQLEVSQQSLKQGKRFEAGFAALEQIAPKKPKTSFVDDVEKIKKPKNRRKTKAPFAVIPPEIVNEPEPEIPGAVTPQTPQLEETRPVPMPELFVKAPEGLVAKIMAKEELVPEPVPEPEPEPVIVQAAESESKPQPEPELESHPEPVQITVSEPEPLPDPEPVIKTAPKRREPVLLRELKGNETRYAGRIIKEEDGQFMFARMSFNSRAAAHRYIDQLGVNPNAKTGA